MKEQQGCNSQKNPCQGESSLTDEEAAPDKSTDVDESNFLQNYILPVRQIEEVSAPKNADWDKDWISATSTRNYLLRDPLVDWLKVNYSSFVNKNPGYTKSVLNAVSDRRNPNSFMEYIMEQGTIFETHVIRLLSEKFGNEIVVSIGGELNPRSPEKIKETINAMLLGVPIIHGALLHNPETRTYGIPDLLVRSDWINGICKIDALDREETRIPALRLRNVGDPTKAPNYHYIVVDVKFTTLSLRADGVHILNCGSFPAYKSQLYIYNEALSRLQGYNPQKAYILGRRWKLTSKGDSYKGVSCFDRLGKIDYHGLDKKYIEKTKESLKWLREVKSESSKTWNLTNPPLIKPELYPNMSNTYDYPWHDIKVQLADNIKELTSLWMVGTGNREIAHSKGIYEWTNLQCTPENLGVNGKFTSKILKKILEVNQPTPYGTYVTDKILPPIINNNLKGWQQRNEIEFYVDFETINDVLTDFETLPMVNETSLVFMIGVGYKEPVSGRWTYKCFCVDKLSFNEEERICQEFADYIRSEAAFYDVENPLCVHWAHAEESFWNDVVERHKEVSSGWLSEEWEWLDLLKVFKEEPIVIRGSLGFGLKQVSTALKKIGCISSDWDTGSSCLDGRGAMVGAWRAHKDSILRKTGMRNTPQIREITKYNEVDVKVLYEIITYLRVNHTKDRNNLLLQEESEVIHTTKKRTRNCNEDAENPRPSKRLRLSSSCKEPGYSTPPIPRRSERIYLKK